MAKAFEFIAEDNPQAARDFLEGLDVKYRELLQFPELGRNRSELLPGLRSFPVGNYLVYYRPSEAGVEILRVLHGARDVEGLFELEE